MHSAVSEQSLKDREPVIAKRVHPHCPLGCDGTPPRDDTGESRMHEYLTTCAYAMQ